VTLDIIADYWRFRSSSGC